MVEVRTVAAEVTFPLRQVILRPHQRVDELAQPDDDHPDSATFAAFADDDGDRVVATGTVGRRPPPFRYEGDAWQVRGMAVAPELQSRGIGSQVLASILDHVARRDGGLAWCNARVPARRLYARAGFTAVGEVFDVEPIGPHIVMTRRVAPHSDTYNSP